MNIFQKIFRTNHPDEVPAGLAPARIVKKHNTNLIVQDSTKCPECGSKNIAIYAHAFVNITEFTMAKCCECDNCGAEFKWLPADYWKVPAVKAQFDAWRADRPQPQEKPAEPTQSA
jgi:hypothetical protein